jgi:hypothetical protein
MLEHLPKNVRVLDLRMNMEEQIEFFSLLAEQKQRSIPEEFKQRLNDLHNPEYPLDQRKKWIAQAVTTDSVEVMRALEKYALDCPEDIRAFAQIAASQSKIFMEASLLNEDQVIIASGLGGSLNKIRYFIVFSSADKSALNELQQSIVRKETSYLFKAQDAEAEEVVFSGYYCKMLVLIPITCNVEQLLRQSIDACNELGNFLSPSPLVSTAKYYSDEELDELERNGVTPDDFMGEEFEYSWDEEFDDEEQGDEDEDEDEDDDMPQ